MWDFYFDIGRMNIDSGCLCNPARDNKLAIYETYIFRDRAEL